MARSTRPLRLRCSHHVSSTVSAMARYTIGCWLEQRRPEEGDVDSTGMWNCARSGRLFLHVGLDAAKAENPAPNRLSARPVAYWLVLSQITSTPKMAASSAPAPMPAAKPARSLPVCTTAAKPAMAAHSIMPSAPRLTMPAFSLISRPSAAMASTVPAFSVAANNSA
jgi:hypothetical protein